MASSSHVVCTVQAFFFYYGNLTMEAWITCILFNVWYVPSLVNQIAVLLRRRRSMVYRKAEPRPHWHYVELCLCWGAPLIGAIILLVTKQFEYDGLAACQIGNRWPVGSNDTLSVPWYVKSQKEHVLTALKIGSPSLFGMGQTLLCSL